MATHSSILAWRISWTEEPGGIHSIGLERVVVLYQPMLDISALNQCKSLKELSLVGNTLDDNAIKVLGNLKNLTKLNLGLSLDESCFCNPFNFAGVTKCYEEN